MFYIVMQTVLKLNLFTFPGRLVGLLSLGLLDASRFSKSENTYSTRNRTQKENNKFGWQIFMCKYRI